MNLQMSFEAWQQLAPAAAAAAAELRPPSGASAASATAAAAAASMGPPVPHHGRRRGGGNGGGQAAAPQISGLDDRAPPLSALLHPDAFRRIYGGGMRDGERRYLQFEQTDYEKEPSTVLIPRLLDAQYELRARANIRIRRRKQALEEKKAAAATSAAAAAAAAGAASVPSRKRKRASDDDDDDAKADVRHSQSRSPRVSQRVLGKRKRDSEDDDENGSGDEDRKPPEPIPLDLLRGEKRSASVDRQPASAAESAADRKAREQREQRRHGVRDDTEITDEELKAEIARMRKEEEGQVSVAEIWGMHEREEAKRKNAIRERELAELRLKEESITATEAKALAEHKQKYAKTPYLDAVDTLAATLRVKWNDERKRRAIFSSANGGNSATAAAAARSGASISTRDANMGERMYQMLEENLELTSIVNKFQYSSMQLLFLTAFSQACAPLVYDKHWNGGTAHAFLARHKLQEHNPFALAMTPRRFGKTWAVVAFVLALAMTQPNLKIVVFSQNERTSQALIAKVKKFAAGIQTIKAWQDRFPGRASNKVTVIPLQVPIPPGTSQQKLQGPEFQGSTITALPCTVDGMHTLLPLPLAPSFSASRMSAWSGLVWSGLWPHKNKKGMFVSKTTRTYATRAKKHRHRSR